MIIRLSLALALAAITSLLVASVFDALALTFIADRLILMGSISLLAAFLALSLTGIVLVVRLSLASFSGYFSARQRQLRKLLFYTNKHRQIERLFLSKKKRLAYYQKLRRKRLAQKLDRIFLS